MPEPKSHGDQRPGIEQLGRRIPGFRGYLEKSYRRESDALVRSMLADRLEESKRALDKLGRNLVDAKRLGDLTHLDRLRASLDKAIGRIRGAMQGYRGVFDLVQIDEEVLDRVYAHDLALLGDVESITLSIESLDAKQESLLDAIDSTLQLVERLDQQWNKRTEILQGTD
jgi:hypothetical protein